MEKENEEEAEAETEKAAESETEQEANENEKTEENPETTEKIVTTADAETETRNDSGDEKETETEPKMNGNLSPGEYSRIVSATSSQGADIEDDSDEIPATNSRPLSAKKRSVRISDDVDILDNDDGGIDLVLHYSASS